ncbi:MAG: phosphoribosylformylglycinamidine cyclo-ligase [Clostridia bacterium]|nr:phosphoribosylformylglycinamidine cyclo-ligase [Clostridia bacterium]
MSDAYITLGASATKSEVHKAIKNQDKGVFPGAFCKLCEDAAGDKNYCSVMHADGAGTKSSLAYIYYRETGDMSVFGGIAQDSTVMNLDDLLCVGITDGFIMSNTIGRNAHRISGEIISTVIEGYSSFVEKMRSFGVNITMSGGETADVGDLVSTLIVDSTFFARIPKAKVIDCANIKPGNVILALASYGKATYENEYNSGISSNGLTGARHLVLSGVYRDKYPESFSSTIEQGKAYSGKYLLTDKLEGTDITVGKALLSPTRTYAPILKELLDNPQSNISGLIHCTGGAQAKCKNFGNGLRYVKDNLFDTPPLFRLIAENSNIGEKEMYNVFNMGHRMEIYCDEKTAKLASEIASKYNVDSRVIGYVEKSADQNNSVIIKKDGKEFIY